jgi:hypothetical protein
MIERQLAYAERNSVKAAYCHAEYYKFALERNKPVFVVQLDEPYKVEDTLAWLKKHRIAILNIAGPREQKNFSVYGLAQNYLTELFKSII